MFTRRMLLTGVAPGAALVLSGCGTTPVDITAAWTNFIDQVQSVVSKGCNVVLGFIPTANTIAAIATALFPSIGAAVAGGVAAVSAVAGAICSAMPATPPAALVRKLTRSVRGVTPPVYIGTVVVNGKPIPVVGYGR